MADGDAVGLDKGNMSENTDFINIDKMVVVKMESQDNEEKEEVTLPAVKSEPQNDADTAEADTALWWCDVTKQECTVTDSSIMEPQSSDKCAATEWTKEGVIEFIDAYRRKEIIWNPKHPSHFNKIRKQDAWEELAKEVKRPVDECKRKMECLLSSLRREKVKIKKSNGAGRERDEVYKSSWFAYESMSFIMDKNKPRPIQNGIETQEAQVQLSQAQKGNPPVQPDKYLPPPPPRKKKKVENQRLEKAFQLLTAYSNQTINDECQHFGNMVAAKLRNFNDSVRCVIESEIMAIFIKANRGFYDHYYPAPLQLTNLPEINSPSVPYSVRDSPSPSIYPEYSSPSLQSQNPCLSLQSQNCSSASQSPNSSSSLQSQNTSPSLQSQNCSSALQSPNSSSLQSQNTSILQSQNPSPTLQSQNCSPALQSPNLVLSLQSQNSSPS
ncbi:uncharacterized protein [Periplaneta americana]|uniref:uncharacterized protein isoform X10 n=1 Tax=Periplaneta americana TaxID=6978 RepID=UPI0037E79355